MKRSDLTQIVREVLQELDEANTSSATTGFHIHFAFGKDKRAKQALKKQGYKEA